MSKPRFHIHQHQSHLAWDNSIPPICTIDSGDVVTFDTLDASNGQITRESTVSDVIAFDFSRLDQVNGPIFIRGASPGDVLEIEFIDIATADWGWTAIIPDFGLLAAEFTTPALKIWKVDPITRRE